MEKNIKVLISGGGWQGKRAIVKEWNDALWYQEVTDKAGNTRLIHEEFIQKINGGKK